MTALTLVTLGSCAPSHPLRLARSFIVSNDVTRQGEKPPRLLDDLSDDMRYRVGIVFREICLLSDNPDGYCWAGSDHFVRLFRTIKARMARNGHFCPASPASIRRYVQVLVDRGLVARRVMGRKRQMFPLIHPSQIVALYGAIRGLFAHRFERLLSVILSGLRPVYLYSSDVRKNNNTPAKTWLRSKVKDLAAQPARLSEPEQVVVMQAIKAGVSPDGADALVRECEAPNVVDAIESLPYQKASVGNPGGWIRAMARRLKAGEWKIPAALAQARAKAERKAERDAVARNRRIANKTAPGGSDKQANVQREEADTAAQIARLDALTPEQLTEAERAGKAALASQGPAFARMAERADSWRGGTASAAALRAAMIEQLDRIDIEKSNRKEKSTDGVTETATAACLATDPAA